MTTPDQRIMQAFEAIVDLGDDPPAPEVQVILSELETDERKDVETLLAGMADIDIEDLRISRLGLLASSALKPDLIPGGTILEHNHSVFEEMNPPLPPFEVLGPLAAGGQAQLYKARSLKPINGTYLDPTVVVLKVFNDAATGMLEASSFHSALILNNMTDTDMHPTLLGDQERDVVYYAMPQFDVDLAAFASHNPTFRAKLNILFHLARFIDRTHSAFIHRDIKPANILLRLSSRGLIKEVILADFGIACVKPALHRLGLTLPGKLGITQALPSYENPSVAFTPRYAAPEARTSTTPTVQLDTYSYAVTAYELLTGELHDEEAHYNSLDRITNTSLKHRIRHGFFPRFSTIFSRALNEDPKKRYRSCLRMFFHIARALHFSASRPLSMFPYEHIYRERR